jgi:lipoate-protein ligase A
MVRIISHSHNDPAFNLACEEYFFKQQKDDIIILWRNSPAIIIGINQNPYAEIDMEYAQKHNIPIIRRLTGGGTVYHDLGNLNFTFITNGKDSFHDFKVFLKPVTEYLRSIGVNTEFSGRNDLLIEGKKISGNAQAAFENRVLHHGTLMFSLTLDVLARVLVPNPLKLQGHAIKSVSSRVTNISSHLHSPMTIEEFVQGLYMFLSNLKDCVAYELSEEDEKAIKRLVQEKYGTWQWNLGKAPKYSIEKSVRLESGIVTVSFDVEKGHITALRISGDFFGIKDIKEMEAALIGMPHEKAKILSILEEIDVSQYIAKASATTITALFF